MLFAQTETTLFENLNFKDKDTAAWEVIIMLVGAYLLGVITYWLIHKFMHHAAETKAVAAAPAVKRAVKSTPDDLTVVEGIGPKINGLLQAAGIRSYEDLATADVSKVKKVLDDAGPRYRMHDPRTWAKQARLAADGKFDALETLKDQLNGGK